MVRFKLFGDYSEKEIKRIIPIAERIEALENDMAALSDYNLKMKTQDFKERLKQGETLDDILVEAFAVVREAAFRVLGMKHYRVQILGGIILHQGRVAEMKTGEGKTLVGTLPVYLNALSGNGVHVITSNEYLAERDMLEMGQVYKFLGLTVDVILNSKSPAERKVAYDCDITYGVNSEIGFDYLRDNMIKNRDERVQRGLNYVLIDEIDSTLIDDARTPLIISGGSKESSEYYFIIDKFVKTLEKDLHYELDEKRKVVTLTSEGIEFTEKTFGIDNYAEMENIKIQHHVTQGLRANYTMRKDVDYIIRDGEILIVDISTGRVMDGRRFSDGLHQAIEAKERVKINEESKTLATITLQNLFRMYKKMSGMSGTVLSEEMEFREIYNVDVIRIPTNRPIQRIDRKHIVYKTVKEKYKAIIDEILTSHEKGQPILVGTSSIEKSEDISALLKRKRISHSVLNAKNHMQEAEIIKNAGIEGSITIATNMAGRGTDIKLTELARKAGGLKVIGTELHDSVRVDNQLRGRSGRQGDVGESVFFVSLEDHIIKNYMTDMHKKVLEKTVINENEPIKENLVLGPVNNAQKAIEGDSYAARKNVVSYDDVLDKQRKIIYNQRNQILDSEDISEFVIGMIDNYTEDIFKKFDEEDTDDIDDIEGIYDIKVEVYKSLSFIHKNISEENFLNITSLEVLEKIISDEMLSLYETAKEKDLEDIRAVEKYILLEIVDESWIDYMSEVDYLKLGIGLRSYNQIDPVLAFQMEASEMFNKMTFDIQKKFIYGLMSYISQKDMVKED